LITLRAVVAAIILAGGGGDVQQSALGIFTITFQKS